VTGRWRSRQPGPGAARARVARGRRARLRAGKGTACCAFIPSFSRFSSSSSPRSSASRSRTETWLGSCGAAVPQSPSTWRRAYGRNRPKMLFRVTLYRKLVCPSWSGVRSVRSVAENLTSNASVARGADAAHAREVIQDLVARDAESRWDGSPRSSGKADFRERAAVEKRDIAKQARSGAQKSSRERKQKR